MTQIKRILFILVSTVFSCLASANPGEFFNISSTGISEKLEITLCLDGYNLITCQKYNVPALNLNIRTTVPNKKYPRVGIKLNTPGFAPQGCTPYKNGFCIFPAQNNVPTTINLRGETPYFINGRIFGLRGAVVLQNNDEPLFTVNTDGPFISPIPLGTGSSYNIHIVTQPLGQICTVSEGVGLVLNNNINNVKIECSQVSYTLGGTIQGLNGSVTLQNNMQNAYTTNNNGSFTLPVNVAKGSSYSVTVQNSPENQTCTTSFADGIALHDVTNIAVICSENAYTVGGNVTNLVGDIKLILNGDPKNTVTISSNSSTQNYTFPIPIAQGSFYHAGILQSPTTQVCSISNSSGVMGNTNVTNVYVSCASTTTTLSTTPSNVIIEVNSPVGNEGKLSVTNTGVNIAYNVRAEIPSGWTDIQQDASDCVELSPGNSCLLKFTAKTPYIAQKGIPVTADNISGTKPTNTFGFSLDNYLVWSIPNLSSALVLSQENNGIVWNASPYCYEIPGINEKSYVQKGDACDGGYDGECDSQQVYNCMSSAGISSQEYAVGICHAITLDNSGNVTAGTWFLPAICQLGGSGVDSGCSNAPNIDTNLFQLGLLPGDNHTRYWSSTTYSYGSIYAWYELFQNGYSSQTPVLTTELRQVYCTRSYNIS